MFFSFCSLLPTAVISGLIEPGEECTSNSLNLFLKTSSDSLKKGLFFFLQSSGVVSSLTLLFFTCSDLCLPPSQLLAVSFNYIINLFTVTISCENWSKTNSFWFLFVCFLVHFFFPQNFFSLLYIFIHI